MRAIVAPKLTGSFLSLDLERARAAFESVPWVRHATVRRVWPDRLAVQLEEHRVAALWNPDTGDEGLVNTYGEVFEANLGDVEDEALPRLSGPAGSAARVLAMWRALAPVMQPLGSPIESLLLTGHGSWRATLANGVVIELGPRRARARWQRAPARFVRTLPQVSASYQRPLLAADLRHADGYAVRLKGVTTTTSAIAQLENPRAHQMAKEYKDLIVGLDIGTAKVMCVVAEMLPDGAMRLAGLGVSASHGLKRGVVVNIDATVQSIQHALKEAEMMAACKIERVHTGITGSHIRGQNSSGMVIVRDNREVTAVDVARVVETAKAINIPNDQRLLLVEPQEFVIDGHEVKEPIGMSGNRLEVKVHIVTGAQSAAENILKCVRRCGLEVEHLVLNPSASSLSVLSADEKDLGVALVDIGAGTTDVAIFTDGSIRHTAVIPIAGDLITSDIAMALRTPTKDAEEIKVEHGVAKQLLADAGAQLEVPGLGDRAPRMLSRQALSGVIEPRVEEIYSLVHQVIRESGYEELLSSGIVITGGTAVMPGMVELGEDIFLKPVRKGVPTYSGALSDMVANPRSATVMGLLEEARLARARGHKAQSQTGSMKSMFSRAKDWIVGNF